jgi:drug/metabolite transporter (DMT)-like permease
MYPGKKVNMFAFGIVLFCIVLSAICQVSLKTGMKQIDRIDSIGELAESNTILNIISNKYVMGGMILYLLSSILWLTGLSNLDLSLMYPLTSLVIVITTIAAYLLLEENITMIRWAGIALVVIGCIVITKS